MADPTGSSNLRIRLREDVVPFLDSCRNPEQFPELVERLARALGADGAVLWGAEGEQLSALATWGDVPPEWAVLSATDSAGATACRSGASVLAEADRAPYHSSSAGADLSQVVAVPVRGAQGRVGAVELWWKQSVGPAPRVAEVFSDLEEALGKSLPALIGFESERRNFINAISRLMMLYDIGKVFHSTLELHELAPLILARVQNILEAQSGAVWLLDPVQKNLYCAAAAGPRGEAMRSTRVWASDAGLGQAVSQGDPLGLHDVDEPEWTNRWGTPLHSILAVPLMQGGRFLGAIEALRAADSPYFTGEDLRLLVDVGKQASVALRNAQRLQVERRVNELNALMDISKEITATLDLDRVLSTAVNRITTVIPADRCSVSLVRRGQWELSAISGEMKVDRTKPSVRSLEALHVWLAGAGGDLRVVQTDAGIEADREETRDKFAQYFRETGVQAFVGFLLRDGEGDVGALVLESKDAASLTPSHSDLARIFASQATVALRNALLYQQLPLAGVLQPLMQKKEKFSALPAMRRGVMVSVAAAVLAFLIFFPWWSKPSGEARVLPERVLPVSAEVDGVVRRVLAGEGKVVRQGELLAELDAQPQRVALEQAQSERDILSRRVLQLEAAGDLGAARIERARLQQVSAQLDLDRTRLERTEIRSPISGVVITPRLEERTGQYLHPGDVFCQVVALDRAWVEVAVPETDIGEVAPGQEAWLKLNTFPAQKFVGRVLRVSPQAREQGQLRVFDVIVEVPNNDPDSLLRAGMMGRGKVLARRAGIGYLMLRVPVKWIWLKVWNWLP